MASLFPLDADLNRSPAYPQAPVARTAVALCAVALLLAGCGANDAPTPPSAGIIGAAGAGTGRAAAPLRRSFDPVPDLLQCLRDSHVHGARRDNEAVTIGPTGQGLRIRFLATGGVAETAQLEGRAEGAEVIGRVLLYPGTASAKVLKPVEDCATDAGLRE